MFVCWGALVVGVLEENARAETCAQLAKVERNSVTMTTIESASDATENCSSFELAVFIIKVEENLSISKFGVH